MTFFHSAGQWNREQSTGCCLLPLGGGAGCQPVGPGQPPSHMGQESRVRYLSSSLCFLPAHPPTAHCEAHMGSFSHSGCPVAAARSLVHHVWMERRGLRRLACLQSSGLTPRNFVLALYCSKDSAFSATNRGPETRRTQRLDEEVPSRDPCPSGLQSTVPRALILEEMGNSCLVL